ncbi:DMT family transporter [Rubellimicrobium roseum]|nr:DMT family transporter [Rubellimicrobium roseum]
MTAAAWVEMALLGSIWGGSFLSNHVALEEAGVATTVAMRVLGAGLVLWAVVRARGLSIPREPRVWGAFLVMGILNNALPFSLITWGQLNIESGLAAILNASTAILGVLVAALVFRDERLTARKALGVGLGFLGVVAVIGPSALGSFDLTSLAQLAILGAALSYAVSGAFARVATQGIAPEVAAAGMLTASSLIMVPAALFLDGMPDRAWSWPTWAALAYLALMASALAYLLFYRLLRRVGAGNTSVVTMLVPPVAILLGAVVLDESLPLRAFGGFALLALGLIILDGRLFRRPDETGTTAG